MARSLERAFVWAGGALFVGSLALAAWTYGVSFGNALPWGGWPSVLVDTLLVTIFALHHSVLARDTPKSALSRVCPERLVRSVYVWIASLLFVMLCLLWRPVGSEVYRLTGWPAVLLEAIQLLGLLLVVQSVRAIDALELAGIRTTVHIGVLQGGGPYRLVRHPVYLGWLLMTGAAAHMTGDRLAFAVITTAYLVIAIPWEERSLERAFGEAYRRYKTRVRWRIVPYVY